MVSRIRENGLNYRKSFLKGGSTRSKCVRSNEIGWLKTAQLHISVEQLSQLLPRRSSAGVCKQLGQLFYNRSPANDL